jgi:NAD(P)-dependent dehydrogenase (short-subunit alcohol dehydrogenase family)
MQLTDRVIIVTGGGRGIGKALCQRFAKEEPRGIVVADRDEAAAKSVAAEMGGLGLGCDVTQEADIQRIVRVAEAEFGPVSVFCSNAGSTIKGGIETSDADWETMWNLHVMSNVYAARAVLPGMLQRGDGYLMQTSSAAGLLTEIGSAAYSVTKHATIALAEWLSIHYRRQGIRVSVLCPSGVQTEMLDLSDPVHQFLHLHSVTPEQVAQQVVEAMAAERFLVLPHKEVGEFFAYKGQDYDKFLHNFAKLPDKVARQQRRWKGKSQG